jgi:hypothetical protein
MAPSESIFNIPQADLRIRDNDVVLVLKLRISARVNAEYVFPLLPVALEPCDLLTAQLRDANEEIAELKKAVKGRGIYLSLNSNTKTKPQTAIRWDGDERRIFPNSHFDSSSDFSEIVVKVSGLYQVYARSECFGLTLNLNGKLIAHCAQSDANNIYNTAQLTETLNLERGDLITVLSGMTATTANPNRNRLSILLLCEA